MSVTLEDLPKAVMIELLKRMEINIPGVEIAQVVIRDKLRRASQAYDAYTKKMAILKKTRRKAARAELIRKINNHVKTGEGLIDSARRIAGEYGLTDRYFKDCGDE